MPSFAQLTFKTHRKAHMVSYTTNVPSSYHDLVAKSKGHCSSVSIPQASIELPVCYSTEPTERAENARFETAKSAHARISRMILWCEQS